MNIPLKQVPKQAPKLLLASVTTRGIQKQAWRILLYGTEGVGKSTVAARTPKPFFIDTDTGSNHLDVDRYNASSWADIRAAIQSLIDDGHEYETVVIDTVDSAEAMLWRFICARDSKTDIEAYGYGKGYQVAIDEWRSFLVQCEGLRKKNINLMMIGHAWLRPFKNPEGEDYDRYELKLHKNAGGLLKEWNDAVLFVNFETFAEKDGRTKRVRGISTGARWIYTTRTAAYDAKNRMNLPEQIALDWSELATAMADRDPSALIAEIKVKTQLLLGNDLVAKATDALSRAGADITKLMQLNSWLNAQPKADPINDSQENNNV